MEIPAGAVEEHAADGAQHGVAQIAVQRRHRTRLDATKEPIAHHQLIAGTKFRDEEIQAAEIVAVVGIPHNDVTAARCADTGQQGAAITLLGNRYDASTLHGSDLLRTVYA